MDLTCLDQDTNSSEDTLNLGYWQSGSGDLLIMIPPPLCDYRIYCNLQQELSKHFRVIAVNLPKVKNLSEVLDILQSEIQKGTTTPFHLIASSATGWIAQFLVQKLNDQVQSLVLLNSFYDNTKYSGKYNLALKSTRFLPSSKFKKEVIKNSVKLFKDLQGEASVKSYFKERVDSLGKGGIRQQMSWFTKNTPPPTRLQIPLLLISSSSDPVVDKTETQQIITNHSDVYHIEISSSSHFVFISDQAEIISYITDFISKMS